MNSFCLLVNIQLRNTNNNYLIKNLGIKNILLQFTNLKNRELFKISVFQFKYA